MSGTLGASRRRLPRAGAALGAGNSRRWRPAALAVVVVHAAVLLRPAGRARRQRVAPRRRRR